MLMTKQSLPTLIDKTFYRKSLSRFFYYESSTFSSFVEYEVLVRLLSHCRLITVAVIYHCSRRPLVSIFITVRTSSNFHNLNLHLETTKYKISKKAWNKVSLVFHKIHTVSVLFNRWRKFIDRKLDIVLIKVHTSVTCDTTEEITWLGRFSDW